jgi:hypothetical protein
MRKRWTLAASAALALSLTGFSAEGVDPPPGTYPPHYGPTCYGYNESHTVWNLVAPMHVFNVDSCRAAVLVSQRNVAGNYANYVALVASRIPGALPVTVYALAWNTGNGALAQCASRGTGVTFYQSGVNGMVMGCSAQ